jgi:hypothetical protein
VNEMAIARLEEIKQTFSVRLNQSTIEKIKRVAPEGNVSLWIRMTVDEKLKSKKTS